MKLVGAFGITKIQTFLNTLGADLVVDGQWGAKTSASLLQFQRKLKPIQPCTVDGRPHPETAYQASVPIPAYSFFIIPADSYITNLNTPYLSQRDNENKPSATCNVTSVAMCLAFNGTPAVSGGVQLEDRLFETLQTDKAKEECAKRAPWAKNIPTNEVHVMLEWLLQQNGYPKAKFYSNASKADIRASIYRGLPVIVATKFTASGHIVVATGLTKDDDLIVNDPWGDWVVGYKNSTDGRRCVYPTEMVWSALYKGGEKLWAIILDGVRA